MLDWVFQFALLNNVYVRYDRPRTESERGGPDGGQGRAPGAKQVLNK